VKIALKCALPIVFEPIKGEFVCVGVEWINSDFGAARNRVALVVWMPSNNRFAVLGDTLSQVHIGSVIEESDIEVSEETSQKEAEAQASAMNDAVTQQLSDEKVERLLNAISDAHASDIPWHKLKGYLAKFVGKKALESLEQAFKEEVVDLPPLRHVDGEIRPTKWWASNALSWLANRTEDADDRLALQHAAGTFISMGTQ
jgi:hypothetical protein